METCENIKVETSYGHCRCCLEEGHHRDITKVYQQNGVRENYGDIFLDCFNVFLSTNMNLSTLICVSCVQQLRSARDFKQLVLRTEEQLMDELLKCDNDQMVLVNVPVPNNTLNTTIGFTIQMHQFEQSQSGNLQIANQLQMGNQAVIKQMENQPQAEFHSVKQSQPVIVKVESTELDTEMQDEESNGSEPEAEEEAPSESPGPVESNLKKPDRKKEEKMALIANTTTLLKNCNATLFKSKMRAGFPCFYCRDIFMTFDLLRLHQIEEHTRDHILRTLKTYSAENLVVYADVTDLKCTICDETIPSLKELKAHLIKAHDKWFYNKITDRVIPFKLLENYFECQICSFNFETFGAVERHMNTHFRNYVCSICGGGFVTKLRLKTHESSLHKEGSFPCVFCDKVFPTQLKHKGHVDFVHRMLKKIKCHKCDERFSDYFVQKKHSVEVHGESPVVYRCNVCNRGFNRRYTLSCHMKRHLDQKEVECDLCTYMCYNKAELREHMMRHKQNGEGTARCNICKKTYSRKKTLKEHMKIHTNDRRYKCHICDHAFVQSNSLKRHMKIHDDHDAKVSK